MKYNTKIKLLLTTVMVVWLPMFTTIVTYLIFK